MRANEFLFEKVPVSDKIFNTLGSFGFKNLKKDSGSTVSIFVPSNVRQQTIKDIIAKLPDAKYDPDMPGSSIGGIRFNNGKIKIRPLKGQGVESAGLDNEQHLIDTINRFIKEVGPLKLTFVGDNGKRISADDVTEAIGAGKDTKNRKKSDVNIISNGKLVPISIKKSNAEYWESADTLYGNNADKIIDVLLANGEITLTPIDIKTPDGRQKVSIKPEVAVKASAEETMDVVFGSDLLQGGGGVVKDTFTDEHYKLEGNHLTVTADLVITAPEDIPEKLQVYFLIRNDSTRNRPGSKYPGLRVLGSYASRVKKAKKVDASLLSAAPPPPQPSPTGPSPTPDTLVQQPQEPQQELAPEEPQQELAPEEPQQDLEPVQQEPAKKKQRLGHLRQGPEQQPISEDLLSILKNAGIR
jgi:hypothetical protein